MSFLSIEASELASYGSSTVYEAAGGSGAILVPLTPLDPAATVAGRARLVACPPGDNLPLHRAVAASEPGDVLVADAGGHERAGHWGEVLTVAAQARGVAGLVIDGSVRDAEPIVARGFPVFHRGLCLVTATKEAPEAPPPEELELGGCTVRAGDWVVGDRDGVVVVPAARLAEVLAGARERTAKEAETMRALAAGATTLELYGWR